MCWERRNRLLSAATPASGTTARTPSSIDSRRGKAYQRQGIAAALLQALVDEAKRQGASRMLLEVRVDNDPALALYQRFGFERMGLRKRYYQPEGIDAYTMSLDLKPRVVGFAAPQTASADIEDITSKQTEKNGEAR